MEKLQVAIIGGGPVGTMCAIQTMEKCGSRVHVEVFEQRSKFTRSQILLLDQYTLKEYIPEKVFNKLKSDGCFIKPPSYDTTARCYQRDNEVLPFAIRISLLEQALWNYAKELGCVMHRPRSSKKKQEMSIDSSELEKFDVIIGAGGKNDIVRQFLNYELVEEQIGDAAIFTWTPEQTKIFGAPSSSTKKMVKSKRRKSTQHRYRMFRTAGNSNYYAAVQLTPDEARKLKNVTKVSEIKDSKTMKIVDSLIKYYDLDIPEEYKGEADVSLIPITLYHAKGYAEIRQLPGNEENKLFLSIGDAIVGVHFFSGTGVNTGFKMASAASDAICDSFYTPDRKLLQQINKNFKHYIDEALEKSRNVILKSSGTCSHQSLTELKKIAKKFNYRGVSALPKHEMCLLLANYLE